MSMQNLATVLHTYHMSVQSVGKDSDPTWRKQLQTTTTLMMTQLSAV